MTPVLPLFSCLISLFPLAAIAADPSPIPLYAFENGLGFGTDAEVAAFLKKNGYAGASQVHSGTSLAGMVAAYEKSGLKVLSVYRDVSEIGENMEDLRPLAGKGALIELTVRKLTPETHVRIREICKLAEGLDMQVAIYPHHGFGIATMPQAIKMASIVDQSIPRKEGRPSLGVMFNLCHFLRNEKPTDLEKVINEAGDYLFAVSISGADTEGKDWPSLIKPLGQGDFNMERFLAALRKSGFDGHFSLQCFALKGDKKENLRASMNAWKALADTKRPNR
jgi:sugar phosphate isomerase/epimerase